MDYIRSKKYFLIDVAIIMVGCLIASLGINLFLARAHLLSGGATGVALIVQYLFGINSGIIVFLVNIPLFVLSYLKLPKKFTLYSTIGMLSLSISLMITSPLAKFISLDDILLYCIYGGLLCGVGYGLVFSRSGSTGGTDIITMIIRKKFSNFNIGSIGFTINLIVVGVGAMFFGIPVALYTLISMFIQGMVLDKVIKGSNSKQLLFILTEKEQLVIDLSLIHIWRCRRPS